MSATRLLVLGAVRLSGRTHGYRIGRELMTWGAEKWANVKWGSIYHALRQLTKEGRLRSFTAEGDEVVERTSYELTEEGETEFLRLLRQALRSSDKGHDVLGAGVTFLPCLPRAEAIALLGERLDARRNTRAELSGYQNLNEDWGKPEHVHELYGLWLATLDGDIAWMESLIARLRAGTYVMADDGPGSFGAPGGRPRLVTD